jgi:hypothetical protein
MYFFNYYTICLLLFPQTIPFCLPVPASPVCCFQQKKSAKLAIKVISPEGLFYLLELVIYYVMLNKVESKQSWDLIDAKIFMKTFA